MKSSKWNSHHCGFWAAPTKFQKKIVATIRNELLIPTVCRTSRIAGNFKPFVPRIWVLEPTYQVVPSGGPTICRQHKASTTAHARVKDKFFNTLPPASQALVTSQSGLFASQAFTTISYTNDFAYPSTFSGSCSSVDFASPFHCLHEPPVPFALSTL